MKQELLENILGIPSRQITAFVVPTLIDEFNFFQEVGTKSWPIEDLRNQFGFDKRVFGTTLAYLEKEGYVQKSNSSVELTENAKRFFVDDKKNMTAYAKIMDSVYPAKMKESISSALRTGKPAKWITESWEDSMRSGQIAQRFSEGLMARGSVIIPPFVESIESLIRGKTNVLDIGGSLGDYSSEIQRAYSSINATVYELPNVAKKAKLHLNKLDSNVDIIEGDMFIDEFPKGFNTHLYSNVIHDWKPDEVAKLFQKSYDSLEKGGIILIHDMHIEKNSPDYVIDHSLYLSIFTNGQCYSNDEMKSGLTLVGFSNINSKETIGGFSVIYGEK